MYGDTKILKLVQKHLEKGAAERRTEAATQTAFGSQLSVGRSLMKVSEA